MLGPRVGALSLAGRVPGAWSGLVGAGAGRSGSQCPAASGADGFAARSKRCWAVVAGSIAGVRPGRGARSNPPWGQVGAPLAGASGVSCCVARGFPGVLRVGA